MLAIALRSLSSALSFIGGLGFVLALVGPVMRNRRIALVGWSLMMMAGGSLIFESRWRVATLGRASTAWPQATAVVTRSVMHTWPSEPRPSYSHEFAYRFGVGAQRYEGDTWAFGGREYATKERVEALVRRHAPGSSITISYDPAKPSRNVVNAGCQPSSNVPVWMGSVLLLLGIGLAIAAGRVTARSSREESLRFSSYPGVLPSSAPSLGLAGVPSDPGGNERACRWHLRWLMGWVVVGGIGWFLDDLWRGCCEPLAHLPSWAMTILEMVVIFGGLFVLHRLLLPRCRSCQRGRLQAKLGDDDGRPIIFRCDHCHAEVRVRGPSGGYH